jgi:hypothetical protein
MITYRCVCGQNLQVADELANCKARCPKCRAVTVVPASAGQPGDSLCTPTELPADGAPTVSSHHDLTIKPPEAGPPRRKEKEANS